MATQQRTCGLFHMTVVPENFEPADGAAGDDEDERSESSAENGVSVGG